MGPFVPVLEAETSTLLLTTRSVCLICSSLGLSLNVEPQLPLFFRCSAHVLAPVTRASADKFTKFYFTFEKEDPEEARQRRKDEHEQRGLQEKYVYSAIVSVCVDALARGGNRMLTHGICTACHLLRMFQGQKCPGQKTWKSRRSCHG